MIMAIFLGGYIFNYKEGLPYILVGLTTLIAAGITLLNTEPKIDSEQFNFQSYVRQTKKGFGELFKNDYIRDFSIYYTLVGGITWYFIYFLSQVFATEIGFTAIQRSWLFAGIYILGELIMFKLISSNVLNRRKVYLMFPIVMIIGFLPGYWLTKTLSIFSIFLLQIISSARFSILDQYSNLEFESKYRATAISALNMAVSIVFALITVVAGKFINNYGSGLIMTGLGVLTIVLVLPFTRTLLVRHKNSRS
jgi:hypothetical protein